MNSYVNRGRPLVSFLAGAGFFFLYFPMVVLIAYSFHEARGFSFPPSGFSFRWYMVLFGDKELLQSIGNSLIVAALVVPLTVALGVPAAFALDRFDFPGKLVFERVLLLPLMIPGLITGLGILLLLKRFDLHLSLVTVAIGHSVAWLPIVMTQVYARLRRLDRSIEEASMDLGANRRVTFWRVILPNIKTSIIGSMLLVFTLSFDEIAITFFLTGTANTLPMHIWAMLRQGVTPEINAIATITIVVSVTFIVISLRLLGGKER